MAKVFWQERVVVEQLVGLAPSQGNLQSRTFLYLDFRDSGRIHNVSIMTRLEVNLNQLLNVDYMHSSLNLRKEYFNGDDSSWAVIIGDAAGEIYAVDPTQVGTDAEISISRKAFKAGTFQKYLEISIAIVGIPLIIAMIGELMVVVGYFMWRTGEKVRRVQASRIALLQL